MERIQKNIRHNHPFLEGIEELQHRHSMILGNEHTTLCHIDSLQKTTEQKNSYTLALDTAFDFEKVFSENDEKIKEKKDKIIETH